MMENLYRSVLTGVNQYVAPAPAGSNVPIGYQKNYKPSLKIK
jgi:hypothetical protein